MCIISVLLMGKSHHSSHDTHIQRPPLSLTKEMRDRPQEQTRVEGAQTERSRMEQGVRSSPGGLTDSLIILFQSFVPEDAWAPRGERRLPRDQFQNRAGSADISR